MATDARIAFVHGVPIGGGGLAVQSANALAALATAGPVVALGPRMDFWPRADSVPEAEWHVCPSGMPWWFRWPVLRRQQGRAQLSRDVRLGRAAAAAVAAYEPRYFYGFTQVSLETLRWARARGIPAILESPNGHIRAFRQTYSEQHELWCSGQYRGHPLAGMVARVEEEYEIADRIRVSSHWTKRSLVEGGVPAVKIHVLQQPVDLQRYRPPDYRVVQSGPLRVVFVGSLDLRKGFVYMLRAVRQLASELSLEAVGSTVDRCTRRLLARECHGLAVRVAPGDPLPAYHRAELCVLPTLEDGSPFAAAEAMACALPLVTTAACGAAEWVDHGRTGWVVPAKDADSLAAVLREALQRRDELPEMGRAARRATEHRADRERCDRAVADWVLETDDRGRRSG